jgi:hypothetical protein
MNEYCERPRSRATRISNGLILKSMRIYSWKHAKENRIQTMDTDFFKEVMRERQ